MDLPVLTESRELIVRYARLLERRGEELGERPLVLPNSRFFPDPFVGDLESFELLVRRMALHAGMSDIPLRVTASDSEESASCGSGSCSSGGCATPTASTETPDAPFLVDRGDHWIFQVSEAELGHPIAMTTRVARALGEIFLVETGEESEPIEEPVGASIDLAATALGFGVLLLEGSYIYSKSCGGPSVLKVTDLSCGQLAVAFACFVARGEHPKRAALKELGASQRELTAAAFELLDSNPAVVTALRGPPELLALGTFDLSEASPALLRLFSRKSQKEPDLADLPASFAEFERTSGKVPARRPKAAVRDEKYDELRALVDEAFDGAGALGLGK